MLADEAHNLSKAGESSSGISNNELRILQLIANGLDTKDIARTLYLSEYTVNDYVKSILRKFGAKNRSHAVAVALRKGLIQ
jgi:DNA-binding CsgD family transcriptional regulator